MGRLISSATSLRSFYFSARICSPPPRIYARSADLFLGAGEAGFPTYSVANEVHLAKGDVMKNDTAATRIYLPESLRKRLKAAAARREMTMMALANQAIEALLDQLEASSVRETHEEAP